MSVDLTKTAVGTFANFSGQPVDYAKSAVLDRAGVPQEDAARSALVYTHASAQGKAVPRLPDPFPPAALPQGLSLETAQDYLDLIAATPPEFVPTAAEAQADKQARAAEAAAAQEKAEEAQREAEEAQREAEKADADAADAERVAAQANAEQTKTAAGDDHSADSSQQT